MKTIKVILGIITALTIVFFATGLFVKETNYTAEVTVNKPVEAVFKTFNQQENLKNWIPEIKSLEVINETIGKTGSTYKMVVENQGQEITMTEKVLAYVPNEKVTIFYDAENMLKTDDYIFKSNGDATTITLTSSCKSDSYIMACLFPYFKGTFQKQDQGYLDNFKEFVEKQ
tara:strand:+ start:131 stop:646 length:516 start_codon:yes stop_codon:yes gene_type:complete